jgi:hypothetical protein
MDAFLFIRIQVRSLLRSDQAANKSTRLFHAAWEYNQAIKPIGAR